MDNPTERVLRYLFRQETINYHTDLYTWYHRGYLAMLKIVYPGR